MSIAMQLLTMVGCFLRVSGLNFTSPDDPTSLLESRPPGTLLRRHEDIALLLSQKPIQGVRKMSLDEGEKFFFDDWRFVNDSQGRLSARAFDSVEDEGASPIYVPQLHPFHEAIAAAGFEKERSEEGRHGGIESRDFKCPTDTHACTNIHRSDRCCGSGSTCELVKDTGSGGVGCCANGKVCSGMVGSCQRGYTACAQALGGGCCIPGYDCVPGGCAYISVVTVTIHSSVRLSTRTYSTTSKASDTPSPSTGSTETTDHLVPPALPTSRSTATDATTNPVDVCPTGFYACSAVYHGGCCQTGRNCDTTSCPTTSSTTLTSDGVIVVVPVTTGGGSQPGRCARGWFSCADTAGGGCCPTGYACGSSCTATAAKSTVAKEQATNDSATRHIAGAIWGITMLWMCMWMSMCMW